jgi:hypothetical protein
MFKSYGDSTKLGIQLRVCLEGISQNGKHLMGKITMSWHLVPNLEITLIIHPANLRSAGYVQTNFVLDP